MEEIIKQIEKEYEDRIQYESDALSMAQQTFNATIAEKEQKIKEVRDYYNAISQKEHAEAVINGTNLEIKMMASSVDKNI